MNSIQKLKVGVVGAGKMGLLHSGIFNNLENTKVTAISEKKKIIQNGLNKYLPNISIYRDYQDMISEQDIDVLVITTPVFLHKEMIETAMDRNLHIFVEKPMAKNYDECTEILQRPYRQKTLVGYCRRFMKTYGMAKEIIENHYLGNLEFFYSHLFVTQVLKPGKGWMYDPELSGGGVSIDLGSHAIDLLHFLFGDIKTIQSFGKNIVNPNVEDYISTNLLFHNQIMGNLQISWSIRNYRLPEFKIYMHFEHGVIQVTEKYIRIFSEQSIDFIKKGWNTYYKQNLTKNVPIDLGGPEYTMEDQHIVDCILSNKKTICNFQEAAKTNLVIDKIYSSVNNQCIESINYLG